jgi:hypothetical protein
MRLTSIINENVKKMLFHYNFLRVNWPKAYLFARYFKRLMDI